MTCSDCGKPIPGITPPPIVLKVDGFSAFGPTGGTPIPWDKVMRLPAFEMFVIEQFGQRPTHLERTPELYQRYCEWHSAKGQWPNETPLGEYIHPEPDKLEE